MDLIYNVGLDLDTITKNIVDLGLPQGPRFYGVTVSEAQTIVHLPDDATNDEVALVESAVASYNFVLPLKAKRLKQLHDECTSYIFSHYDAARQASLNALLTEAVIHQWSNRIGYIGSALAWIKSVINYYYAKQDEIKSASTVQELDGVVWSFGEQFDMTDPNITLREAQDLTS